MDIQNFIEKFAEAIEVEDVDVLNADTNFKELDEWSSLSVMLLIAMVDEEFDKTIGDKEISQIYTIGELYNLIQD